MIIIKGQYNEAEIFTDYLEPTAREQIQTLCDQPFAAGSKIRIMPDVHAGAGSTIGTTMTIKDKLVPNLVGVDIGCGMETIRLADKEVNWACLDQLIREKIPAGHDIRKQTHPYLEEIDLSKLRAREGGRNDGRLKMDRAYRSLGTLGGGNHFIEGNRDEEGRLYIVVHSGSRHLGLQIALHYQRLAQKEQPHSLRDLAYLQGQSMDDYCHDMQIMQRYAVLNRKAIIDVIIQGMNLEVEEDFTTIHNYIDLDKMILRKGAISAQAGELALIPLNMRDGSFICRGKGNPEWNYSAPHGAGRIMSRSQARKELSLKSLHEDMAGIFTTSVKISTLDESPAAYKPMAEISRLIRDTVDVLHHIKPEYNFKA
ncbi:MAG: RtcB family protein [Clostridiaceae bacterium]|jgi:RNA-splicing ligase RtcB|nr:RtcB family protein [Clostridiaceae bacterium]